MRPSRAAQQIDGEPATAGSTMTPRLLRIGSSGNPVVVIDSFLGDLRPVLEEADALAPYPQIAGNHYPGLRRIVTEADPGAYAYVVSLLESAAQFIAGAFDCSGFDLLEASFSMVTADPASLKPAQSAPHFDSTDPDYLAVLHYLHVPENTGTAFYRQRSTGIEQVSEANVAAFVRTAEREAALLPAGAGYIQGSDAYFEQIGAVEAVPDRLIIYRGSLLHSGIIPPQMVRSGNPREGRLTANIFVRATGRS